MQGWFTGVPRDGCESDSCPCLDGYCEFDVPIWWLSVCPLPLLRDMCETFKQFSQLFGEEDSFEDDFFQQRDSGGGGGVLSL